MDCQHLQDGLAVFGGPYVNVRCVTLVGQGWTWSLVNTWDMKA